MKQVSARENSYSLSSFSSVAQAHDGGYIIAGAIASSPFNFFENITRIIKTDLRGNTEWTFVYPPLGESTEVGYYTANSIIVADDGECEFTGSNSGVV